MGFRKLGEPLAKRFSRLGQAGGAFSPRDVDGLLLWLKSDAGTFQDIAKEIAAIAEDDPVKAWADQSGNGNDAIQSDGAKTPILKLATKNGKNAILWDGDNDCLVTPSISYGIFTIFCVFATVINEEFAIIYERGPNANTSDGENLYVEGVQKAQLNVRRTNLTKYRGGGAIGNQSWYVSTHTYNGNNADNLLRLNGGLDSFSSNPLTDDPGTGSISDVINLGATNDGLSAGVNGYIVEFLVYNSVLSTDSISLIEAYLNNRFAVY